MAEGKRSRVLKRIRQTLALFAPGLVAAYDYDSHMMRRAFAYGCGAFFMLMAFCVQALCRLLPATEGSDAEAVADWLDHIVGLLTKEFVDGTFSSSHIISTIALFAFLGIGAAICLSTRKDHDAFVEVYPQVESPYSEAQAKKGERTDRIVAWVGVAAMLAGGGILIWRLACMGGSVSSAPAAIVDALGFFLLACGAFAAVTGRLMARRFDVFAYNYEALRRKSPYEIYEEKDGPERDLALNEKALQEGARWLGSVVWGVAVIMAFVLFALPTIRTVFYWIPLAIAAIVLHVYKEHNLKIARAYYDKAQAAGQLASTPEGSGAAE